MRWIRNLERACSRGFWEENCGTNIWQVRGRKKNKDKEIHGRNGQRDAGKYAVGETSRRFWEGKCGTKYVKSKKKCRRKRKYGNVEQNTTKRTIVGWKKGGRAKSSSFGTRGSWPHKRL